MRTPVKDDARPGRLAKARFRVSDAEAEHCERFIDKYLGQILGWGGGGAASDRAGLVRDIGRNLIRADGRTFIEQLFLVWRAARESRDRVNQLRARARRINGTRGARHASDGP